MSRSGSIPPGDRHRHGARRPVRVAGAAAGLPLAVANKLRSGLRGQVPAARPRPRGDAVPAETHVEKGPLNRQQVLELVRDLLADILEIEPAGISQSSSFAEDLDADSLALIELVEGLEEDRKSVV